MPARRALPAGLLHSVYKLSHLLGEAPERVTAAVVFLVLAAAVAVVSSTQIVAALGIKAVAPVVG